MMQFGDILRELLEEHGITQRQLGRDLCLAPSTLGNYVNNTREPDYATLKRIAGYFRVSTDYLLDYPGAVTVNHQEERLLRQFRSMDQRTKQLFLAQGNLLLQFSTDHPEKLE